MMQVQQHSNSTQLPLLRMVHTVEINKLRASWINQYFNSKCYDFTNRTRAIITRFVYFLHHLWRPKMLFKELFCKILTLCTVDSRAVYNRERVMIARVRYSKLYLGTQWFWAVVQREKKCMAYDLHPVLIPYLVSQNS